MEVDLEKIWRDLSRGPLNRPITGSSFPTNSSQHTIARLMRNYKIKMTFAGAFLIVFVVGILYWHDVFIRSGLSVLIAAYAVFFASSFDVLRKLRRGFSPDVPLIAALVQTRTLIEENLIFEKRVGLIIYPFAAATGFFVGFISAGGTSQEAISNRVVALWLVGAIVVLTPLCYWVAGWMYKVTYGKCLVELTAMINELNSES